jgi:hypothetical protein
MKADAHYYAVLAFARSCGFTKEAAYQIAYASQFVDDAIINLMYIEGDLEGIAHDTIEGRPCFFDMSTCHSYMKINTFDYSSMVNNTVAFHFVPGCKGKGFTRMLRCSEDSPVIKKIMRDALKEKDLIRLGVALHAFADTYSHQGFSGLLSKVNDIRDLTAETRIPWELSDQIAKVVRFFTGGRKHRFDRLMDAALPAYGHAQALEYPDFPYIKWSYKYDKSKGYTDDYSHSGSIDNRARYRAAFEKIREHLESYLSRHPLYADPAYSYKNHARLYAALVAFKSDRGREKNWKSLLVDEGLFSRKDDTYLDYDRNRWLDEAFANFDRKAFNERSIAKAVLSRKFRDSRWYRFYLAVKWYKELFFTYCENEKLKIPL